MKILLLAIGVIVGALMFNYALHVMRIRNLHPGRLIGGLVLMGVSGRLIGPGVRAFTDWAKAVLA